jgi:hypothetical protein
MLDRSEGRKPVAAHAAQHPGNERDIAGRKGVGRQRGVGT